MNTLKQILFTFVAIAGLSLAVSAQKGGDKKPPKEKPPVINPKDKPPPRETPKPKKPGMSYFVALPTETVYAE